MKRLTPITAAVASCCLLAVPDALATITFAGIEGKTSSVDLDDRIGPNRGDSEHRINIDDCNAYAGAEATVTAEFSTDRVNADFEYIVVYAGPGDTCESSLTPSTADGCVIAKQRQDLDQTSITFDVELDKLIGNACDSGMDSDTATILVFVKNETTNVQEEESLLVDVDLKAPVAPILDDVSGGDRRFEVSWTDDSNDSADVTYTVYYSDSEFSDPNAAGVSDNDDINTTSVSIESDRIVNGVTYYVRVAAVDLAENESTLSVTQTVVPLETQDFWEAYTAAGGTDEGGFCFIATAAYGSSLAGELNILRAFRDRILMSSEAGRAFVAGYYKWGRFAAGWIADKPVLRSIVRVLLVPLVWFAKLALWLTPLGALMVMMMIGFGLAWVRRRWVARVLSDLPVEVRS